MQQYIVSSIELHLFFSRIMKEHALFLEAGMPSKYHEFIETAEWYKNSFEEFILNVIEVGGNLVRPNLIASGEIVTEYTLNSEIKTEQLSGISINKNITMMETNLPLENSYNIQPVNTHTIKELNNQAIRLLDGLIAFKEKILKDSLSCDIFTSNYPLLLDHILREAKLYRSLIIALENNQNIEIGDLKQTELFWNQIMMEHALFIRGLLDPTENDLINTANDFAHEYRELLVEATSATTATMESMTNKAFQETLKYRDFKTAGAKGLNSCEIKSIILPLLADHVLREANHYLRILKN